MLQRFELQSTFRRSLVNDSQRNDGQLSVSTTVTQWRLLLRQSRTLLRHCCWCGRGFTVTLQPNSIDFAVLSTFLNGIESMVDGMLSCSQRTDQRPINDG